MPELKIITQASCPFTYCGARVDIVTTRAAADNTALIRVIKAHVTGDAPWFGMCPAGSLTLPLNSHARATLVWQATMFERMRDDRDQASERDSPIEPTRESTPARPPMGFLGNDAPEGSVPRRNRVWGLEFCSYKGCDIPIAQTRAGWVHVKEGAINGHRPMPPNGPPPPNLKIVRNDKETDSE